MSSFRVDRSAALFERAGRSLATGVASGVRRAVSPVLAFERGDGPYFFDADGHKLLDYTLAWGPLIAGANHPRIAARVTEQLARGVTFGALHEGEIALAEALTRLVPGVEQVILSNSGTEAVQAALRLARATTGRDLFVKFEGHYHGWLNNVLVSYRPKEGDPVAVTPGCGGQPASEYADTLVLPWNDVAALEAAFAQYPQQIAAVLCEPLLANGGCCLPEPGYLEAVVALCRSHGSFSLFDEVITGFRLALGGARSYFGVEPDLSIYGKALAGGFPLSAVGGRRAAFDVLRSGQTFHAGTSNGHPVNVAAALATLEILSDPGVFERMYSHGTAIQEGLRRGAEKHGLALTLTGAPPVFGVHFGLSEPPKDYRATLRANAARYARFRTAMLEHGVLLLPDGRWYVGATHGDEELQIVLGALAESLASL